MSSRIGEAIKIVDSQNLAPDGFAAELSKCLGLLPFKVNTEIPICVEEHNVNSRDLAWNGVEYGEELQMTITLFARDIDANVRYNRMNYWLFITLHELAHIYYRQQDPESVLHNLEDECNRIAYDTLQVYKEKYG